MAALLLLLCFLAQGPSAPPRTPSLPSTDAAQTQSPARLEGRVVNLVGDPLRKATVRLQMMSQPPPQATPGPMQMPMMTNYTATSDAEGNFVFEDVEPGRFNLSGERNGYVRTSYGAKGPNLPSTLLTLSASQKMTGVLLKMTPQAIIAGKVTDEDGDPFPGASVQLYRVTWNQGRRQLQTMNSSQSLPDGSFMIANLAAGKYYLSATSNQIMRGMGVRERGGRKGPLEDYVTTYYPNALESAQAAPIELTAGIDVRGIEIRMRKTRVFRITGRVVHSSGAPPMGAVLNLIPASSSDFFNFNRFNSFIRDKEGIFEFHHVLPGSYVVQTQPGGAVLSSDGSSRQPMLGRLAVTVANEDVENLVMTLGPGVEISGQFILEGVGPLNAEARAKLAASATGTNSTAGPGRLPSLQLAPAEGINFGGSNSQTKDDGSFLIKNAQPDRYRMTPAGLPDGCYVKQIRYGGQDVTRSLLDLTAGSSGQLEILLSPNAAQISGVVRNEKGEIAKETTVTVWQTVEGQSEVQGFLRRTDQNGSFKLANLAPGDYRVIAWEQVEPGMANDSDFRSKFESKATAVKLQENSRETVEPKLLPFAVIEAEAAKIR